MENGGRITASVNLSTGDYKLHVLYKDPEGNILGQSVSTNTLKVSPYTSMKVNDIIANIDDYRGYYVEYEAGPEDEEVNKWQIFGLDGEGNLLIISATDVNTNGVTLQNFVSAKKGITASSVTRDQCVTFLQKGDTTDDGTLNYWAKYVDETKASKATGGPTLNIYKFNRFKGSSYNSSTRTYTFTSTKEDAVRNRNNVLYGGTYYRKNGVSYNSERRYWLASPSINGSSDVYDVTSSGGESAGVYDRWYEDCVRPLVYLRSEIEETDVYMNVSNVY